MKPFKNTCMIYELLRYLVKIDKTCENSEYCNKNDKENSSTLLSNLIEFKLNMFFLIKSR